EGDDHHADRQDDIGDQVAEAAVLDHQAALPIARNRSASASAQASRQAWPFCGVARRASPMTPVSVISLKERWRETTCRRDAWSSAPKASGRRGSRTEPGASTIIIEV